MATETYQSDVNKRMTERARLIALFAGLSGLVVNFLVCIAYAAIGEANTFLYTEVAIYAVILVLITWSAYARFRVNEIFTMSLLCILAVFWSCTFIEGALGYNAAAIDYPLILFVPLFLVIMLEYRLLFYTAPIQAACVFFYTRDYAIEGIGPHWSAGEQMAYTAIMAALSGFSFCGLGVVSYARQRADTRMFDLVSEKEELASIDGLTGLMNRRAFMEKLRRLWTHQPTIEIAFIDLDHFKPLNDQ